MILTRTQIIIPRAFSTKRYAIPPQTQAIRWDRRYTRREHGKVGEARQSDTFETSKLLMAGQSARAVPIASAPYGSGRIEQRADDLRRVAGIDVQHLTPEGMVSDPAPPPTLWPKPDELSAP